jgi:hypothetical protein
MRATPAGGAGAPIGSVGQRRQAVEVTPEQEPVVSSEPVGATAEPVAEPPPAEGEQQAPA